MIGYVNPLTGTVTQLQSSIDLQRKSTIQLVSLSNITCDNSAVHIEQTGNNNYEVDLSGVADETVVTFTNDIGSVAVTIYNAAPRTDHLEHWLTMQQLGHLIPLLKNIGWSKLKEAALKAKQLSDLQGTEQSLQILLDLLDADDNVVISRYWQDIEGHRAFDNLTATDLADNGFKLTNDLKVAYMSERLDPWSNEITQTVQSLGISLPDLVTALRGILPVTLQITDYELIKLGIGMICFDYMSAHTKLQYSDTDVNVIIDMPCILQYDYLPFVYDQRTRQLTAIASASNQGAIASYQVIFKPVAHGKVTDFTLTIGDFVFSIDELSDDGKAYCIQPPIGQFEATYSYITESGNRFECKIDLTVFACNVRQEIYELTAYNEGDTDASEVDPYNIVSFALEYEAVSRFCNGRPNILPCIRTYQKYYVPYARQQHVRIVSNAGIYEYDLSLQTVLADFTVSVELVTLFGNTEPSKYYVLTTKQYAGRYDYAVQIKYDNEWVTCNQLAEVLTHALHPMWTRNDMQELLLDVHATASSIIGIAIDGELANNGGFMPLDNMQAKFCNRLRTLDDVMVNDNNGNFMSIAKASKQSELSVQLTSIAKNMRVRRVPSFALRTVGNVHASRPYIVLRPNTWIDVYTDDRLTKSAYGMLIFAKVLDAKYTLHLYNDWFDKIIEI